MSRRRAAEVLVRGPLTILKLTTLPLTTLPLVTLPLMMLARTIRP